MNEYLNWDGVHPAVWLTFLFSVLLLFHSYLFYPLLLTMAGWFIRKRKVIPATGEYPPVSILMAVHNEEDVLAGKLESIMLSRYPHSQIELLIGSDCSTDATDSILQEYSAVLPFSFTYTVFQTRMGKGNIINLLVARASHPFIIITDANVFFTPDTIGRLMERFNCIRTGLVDSCIVNTGIRREGISYQESTYLGIETHIKHIEGELWGAMTGPSGGCYALRRHLFVPVPKNFLVDDFFICMHIIRQGYHAVSNPQARVYEDVSNNIMDEFRRKVRIAAGNFQNLSRFAGMLIPFGKNRFPVAFAFFSHKVIRWFGPWLILLTLACLFFMAHQKLFLMLGLLLSFSFFVPLFDWLLRQAGIHNVFLRFITHFYAMNAATLIGFVKYLTGVKTNVWKPTKRNQ